MRLRAITSSSAVVVLLALPVAAHATGIPFFGPVVPEAINRCAGGFGAFMTVLNNVIALLITLAITAVAPLMIAYSGFLFVVNPVSSEGKSKAKGILLNTIVGIVIALSGWLIVNAVMVTLYHPSDASWSTRWSEIITGNSANMCVEQAGSLTGQGFNFAVPGVVVTGVGANGGAYLTLPNSGDCSPSALLSAVAGSQYQLTPAQANVLSCIAVPESSCGKNTTGAKQSNGKPTTASGMFQVVLGLNDTCHNLNIPACTAAAAQAGYTVNGDLNCSKAFRDGKPKPDMQALAAACQFASANLNCNVQAAACLVKGRPSFSDWTSGGDGYTHATQKNCVTQYAKN